MRRVHAIALVCLDTGCRVKEVLGLRFGDVDLDAMVLRVYWVKADANDSSRLARSYARSSFVGLNPKKVKAGWFTTERRYC